MRLNISYPATALQKKIEIDDAKKIETVFYDKRISEEVKGDALGDEFKGYIFRITGGNDKQGFTMKQGVLTNTRVRLLISGGNSCYRPRRDGERRRKSVRGCIVGPDISALSLVIVKKGEGELPGITDGYVPRRLGPKRASNIRKLFNLTKEDDVRKYVIRREITREGKKPYSKAPRIQRLVTPVSLQRKRHLIADKKKRMLKTREDEKEYAKMLAQRSKERKASQKLARSRAAKKADGAEKSVKPVKAARPAKPKLVPGQSKRDIRRAAKKAAAAAAAAAAAGVEKEATKKVGKKDGKKPASKDAKPAAKVADKAPAAKDAKPAAKVADKAPAAKKVADKAPAAKKVADKAPAAKKVADKAPAAKEAKPAAKVAEKAPAAKAAEKAPVAKAAEKAPAAKKAATEAKKPAAKKSDGK